MTTARVPGEESQWLYTPLELLHAPSIAAGFTPENEAHHRALAVRRLMCLKDVFVTCVASLLCGDL